MAKRHEKMLNVTNYQISANENHNEISPPEWLSSINQQTTSAGEDVEKGNHHSLLVGMQIRAATVENSMEIP